MIDLTSIAGVSDPLGWARFPRSQTAVDFLLKGSANDRRLADILAEHRMAGVVTDRGELVPSAAMVSF